MSPARAYPLRQTGRSAATRARILDAVRALLAEGAFHHLAVEDVAARAGVSRATVYGHFRSRLDLVDAICETFDANPALQRVRQAVVLPDPSEALAQTIADVTAFWSAEAPVLTQIYGVVAADSAAQALVERQTDDRRGEMRRLVATLRSGGRTRHDVDEADALDTLMVLTSFETYQALVREGRGDAEVVAFVTRAARRLLERDAG